MRFLLRRQALGLCIRGILYLHGGAEELYSYPQIYPKIPSQWGTYAIRLLRKSTYRSGNGQAEINPLRIIVEKMKKQLAGGRMRAVYEANLVEDTDYLTSSSRLVAGQKQRPKRLPPSKNCWDHGLESRVGIAPEIHPLCRSDAAEGTVIFSATG